MSEPSAEGLLAGRWKEWNRNGPWVADRGTFQARVYGLTSNEFSVYVKPHPGSEDYLGRCPTLEAAQAVCEEAAMKYRLALQAEAEAWGLLPAARVAALEAERNPDA